MKKILSAILAACLVTFTALSFSQTTPSWATGFVPTAAQWNALWASKADTTSSAVAFTGGTINGVSLGATTPSSVAATTLSASGSVTGIGFTNLFASPFAIGSTTASTGAFTNLSASGTLSGVAITNYLASPPAIGGTVSAAGAFTTLSASSTVSGTGFSTYLASPPAIGGTVAAAGSFTTISGSTSVSAPLYMTPSSGRAVNSGATSDTLAASKSSTYENANTPSSAFTVLIAAPTGDGERRRICFANITGTITWTVTAPATQAKLPTTVAAGGCVEMVYSSVNGAPSNAQATTWYEY